MKAIFDVFSGRPNPSWELTPQQAQELAKRLTGLVPANRAPAQGGLGYRGFTIANPDQMAGLPIQISVSNGVIGLSENGRTTYYQDTNNVEDWLIKLARQQGHGAILDQLIGNKGQ